MSAITPNVDQFKALAQAASTDNGTVVMVNLLKYRRSGGSGEYRQYGDSKRMLTDFEDLGLVTIRKLTKKNRKAARIKGPNSS